MWRNLDSLPVDEKKQPLKMGHQNSLHFEELQSLFREENIHLDFPSYMETEFWYFHNVIVKTNSLQKFSLLIDDLLEFFYPQKINMQVFWRLVEKVAWHVGVWHNKWEEFRQEYIQCEEMWYDCQSFS